MQTVNSKPRYNGAQLYFIVLQAKFKPYYK